MHTAVTIEFRAVSNRAAVSRNNKCDFVIAKQFHCIGAVRFKENSDMHQALFLLVNTRVFRRLELLNVGKGMNDASSTR
jgi:hypothetical protein